METAERYRNQFIQEVTEFKEFLNRSLQNWSVFITDRDSLDHLFRTAHSIKSGASFLNLGPLEERAHQLEEQINRGIADQKNQMAIVQEIQKLLIMLERKDLGGESPAAVRGESDFRELNLEDFRDIPPEREQENTSTETSDFEKFLLSEARERGEQLYRIECKIDRDEPMKRARAYLILNNLELHSTVLRTEPSMDDERAHFNPFILHITSNKTPDELRRLIRVDRLEGMDIRKLSLQNLDQISLEGDSIVGGLLQKEQRKLTIGREDLEDLHSLWQELGRTLRGTRWEPAKARRLKQILFEGRNKVEEISRFSIKEIYPELRDRVADYGTRLDKPVELLIQGTDILMPREWLAPLLKILQQLIRNSLVHGLEPAEERSAAGKPEKGCLILELSRKEGMTRLSYSDDGRGVDEQTLRTKVAEMKDPTFSGNEDLIQLIGIRGLSSTREADSHSGRGVGMDLVGRIVEQELEGSLHLKNTPGQGVLFHLDIPGGNDQELLQFRYRSQTFMVDKRYIRDTGHLKVDNIWRNRSGQYHLKEQGFQPLFTPFGKVVDPEGIRQCSFWIKIRYMGKTACIVAEELMQERQTLPEWKKFTQDPFGSDESSHLIQLEQDQYLILPNMIE